MALGYRTDVVWSIFIWYTRDRVNLEARSGYPVFESREPGQRSSGEYPIYEPRTEAIRLLLPFLKTPSAFAAIDRLPSAFVSALDELRVQCQNDPAMYRLKTREMVQAVTNMNGEYSEWHAARGRDTDVDEWSFSLHQQRVQELLDLLTDPASVRLATIAAGRIPAELSAEREANFPYDSVRTTEPPPKAPRAPLGMFREDDSDEDAAFEALHPRERASYRFLKDTGSQGEPISTTDLDSRELYRLVLDRQASHEHLYRPSRSRVSRETPPLEDANAKAKSAVLLELLRRTFSGRKAG